MLARKFWYLDPLSFHNFLDQRMVLSVFGPCFHFFHALLSVPPSAVCGCGVVVVVYSHTHLLVSTVLLYGLRR